MTDRTLDYILIAVLVIVIVYAGCAYVVRYRQTRVLRTCQGNGPCPPGKVCMHGVCVDKCPQEACPSGSLCNSTTGRCEVVADFKCQQNKDCPKHMQCNKTTGSCEVVTKFACLSDTDCPPHMACDPSVNTCKVIHSKGYVPPPTPTPGPAPQPSFLMQTDKVAVTPHYVNLPATL